MKPVAFTTETMAVMSHDTGNQIGKAIADGVADGMEPKTPPMNRHERRKHEKLERQRAKREQTKGTKDE
jgi:hypothetical protein